MNERQMDLDPESFLMSLVHLARSLSKRRLWTLASIAYALALRLHGPKIDSVAWRELNVVLGASGLNRLGKRLLWRSTNTSLDVKMEAIKLKALRGKSREALAHFQDFSDKQFPAELGKQVGEGFRKVVQESDVDGRELEALVDRYTSDRRVVLVAGLDFSGSSAVFDFFREFENAVPVETEIPHLSRGRYCLYEVSRHLNDRAEFRRHSLEFFCRYVLGFSRITEVMDFRIHKFARRRALSRGAGQYAESVKTCGALISAINAETSASKRRRIFDALVNQVLTEIVVETPLQDSDILVFRNAIKAVNLSQAASLGSFTVIACFRDPRDSYVAQTREKFHHGIPVKSWIDRALRNHVLADAALRDQEKNSRTRIARVQFEDFVRSVSTRRTVADFSGLSESVWNPEVHFVPTKSQRNIGMFRDFGEPSAISAIEDRMRNFLHNQ